MKTEQEIRQMVNACNLYRNCGGCPYNPEDISRFIGDRWKGGCPNYDKKLVYAMGKGYGDVSEYKAEIKRLKKETSDIQKRTAKEILQTLYDECYEINDESGESMGDFVSDDDILHLAKHYGVEVNV